MKAALKSPPMKSACFTRNRLNQISSKFITQTVRTVNCVVEYSAVDFVEIKFGLFWDTEMGVSFRLNKHFVASNKLSSMCRNSL